MHIGYFSSVMGTQGGVSFFDKRVLENISAIDNRNEYTVYGLTNRATQGLQLKNDNFTIRTIRPSGKWLGISIGLTMELMRSPVDLLHATIIAPPIVPCKFVTTMTCWSWYSQPELYPPLIRWRLTYLITRAVRNASAVFCYTDYLRQKVIEKFDIDPERAILTQPGLGDEIKKIEDKQLLKTFLEERGIKGPYILFIGELKKRKNVSALLRAYHILLNEAKIEHKLVLLGEKGYYFNEIQNTLVELNLENHVVFVGWHPYDQLSFFYNGADVFVFPTFSEGFGLPLLEAMACGTPVVASNTTAVPEVVGDAALLVDPNCAEDIAEAILSYLTDHKHRENMIRKGLIRASKFTLKNTASQVISGYEKVHHSGW